MLNKWHSWLDMPIKTKQWHLNDMADELQEYYDEKRLINKWSELCDVVYTCTRARWGKHTIDFPFNSALLVLGVIYMIPKYTNRRLFYKTAGKRCGVSNVREVRNPKKVEKLHHIAKKYDIDPLKFQIVCEKQLKYWPLLP